MIIGIVIISLIIITAGYLLSIPLIVIHNLGDKHVDFKKIWSPEEFDLKSEHFFVKTDDKLNISVYEVEVKRPKAVVICLPGMFTPSATIYYGHARFFKRHGYATVMLDMRGHGESDGDHICLGYREWMDVKAVVNHIKKKPIYENVPVVVMGLSMGAVTAINSMAEIPEIDGLISLSAYSAYEDIFHDNMLKKAPRLLTDIVKPFVVMATALKYKINTFRIRPTRAIKKLGNRPALLMHTKEDSEAGFINFERLMKHAPEHVETFVRKGNYHMIIKLNIFTEPEGDAVYANKIMNFLDSHFQPDSYRFADRHETEEAGVYLVEG